MDAKISQINPRSARLPKPTGVGGRPVPFHTPPILNPDLLVQSNQRIRANLDPFHPIDAASIQREALAMLNRSMEAVNRTIHKHMQFKGIVFGVSQEANRLYVHITDTRTGEVIKTIPSDAALRLAAKLNDLSGLEDVRGMLVSRKG
ncbi:MAG: flagellar protein FlaG [Candidatus Lambdaproteobacteria bacterium]|nr:flagellar protein FlaG [Candidatus Lambdaproteobacteria bacterium]